MDFIHIENDSYLRLAVIYLSIGFNPQLKFIAVSTEAWVFAIHAIRIGEKDFGAVTQDDTVVSDVGETFVLPFKNEVGVDGVLL